MPSQPNTIFLKDTGVMLDDYGFILTDPQLTHQPQWQVNEHHPEIVETSMPGVFAASDVRHGSTKQVAAATGKGTTTALFIRDHLDNL